MGYYTNFDISQNTEEVQQDIESVSGYGFYSGCVDGKWYGWEKDCKEVSLKHPNILIRVEGDGEERGDQWKAYFLNGKSQVCKAVITFEGFDESKLK
jgi:hypothetical protein